MYLKYGDTAFTKKEKRG